MGDKSKVKGLTNEIEDLNASIEELKKLCRDLKGNDNHICSRELRRKAASGQHGLKDNATRKQVREGLEERIDQLKRDAKKKSEELTKLVSSD